MSTPSFSSVLHNGTYRTRYLFNGKELDTETNLYYYGARYFEPREILWYGVDPLTEKYPFNSGYVYCNGNPVKYVDLWGENPTEEEAARMSAHVYGDQPDDILIGGWKVSNKAEELGITLTHNKSGFKSQLYERTNKDGETEYTYAFAGTDFDQVNDWANNAAQLVGLSKQYAIAKRNALKLKDAIGNNLTFTGHSLGGGMAAYVSSITRLPAKTFNAARVSCLTNKILCPIAIFTPQYYNLAKAIAYCNVDAYVQICDELRFVEGNPDGKIHFRVNRASYLGHSINNFYDPGFIEKAKAKLER